MRAKEKGELLEQFEQTLNELNEESPDKRKLFLAFEQYAYKFYTIMFFTFAYVMGRWPHNAFYYLYLIVVPLSLLMRYIEYRSIDWQFYLLDFCYYGNAFVLLFLAFAPKNEYLFRISFFFSNGILAAAVVLFNNKLILNSSMIVNLPLHLFPSILMYNIKMVTMPYELTIPEEQRWFTPLPKDEAFFS